jgi:hypothetical protein
MFGRRSHQRYTISSSPEATLRMLRDVLVERISHDEIVVIGRHVGVVGDLLKMQIADAGDFALPVRVIESRPSVADGTMRHRLVLGIERPRESVMTASSGHAPEPALSVAVLEKETPVRVLNCSTSGCLLEIAIPIDLGTIAALRLPWQAHEFADDIQIVRCQPIEGGSRYHVGAAFLWTSPPRQGSFRLGFDQAGHAPARNLGG